MKLSRIAVTVLAAGQFFAPLGTATADPPPDHEKAERRYIELLRASASDPGEMAHPELVEPAKSLFEPKAVALDFSTTEALRSGLKKTTAGTIWYSEGRIFIEHTKVPDGETPWSYATVGGKLLGWKHGDSKAVSFKRYPGDTVDFLWYITDASAIKASLHFTFLQDPSAFDVRESPPWRRLVLREPLEGFSELVVRESPLWLRTLVYRIPAGDTVEVRMTVEPPRAMDALPKRLESIVPNLEVEPTDRTIKSRMEFL